MSLALTPVVLLVTLAAQILSGFVGAATTVCIGEQGVRLEVQTLGSDGCSCHGEHPCGRDGAEAQDAAREPSGCKRGGCAHGRSSSAEPSGRAAESRSLVCGAEAIECRHDHACGCAHVALPSDKPTLDEKKLKKPEPAVVFLRAPALRVSAGAQEFLSIASFSRPPPGHTVLTQLSTLFLLL